jgi:Ser/Thr protein kinase RdoA (MazF antagonist)
MHANNVLFHGDDVNMIDFDQGGPVLPGRSGQHAGFADDLRLVNPDTTVEGLGAAFLEGYNAVRPLPSTAELAWYTVAVVSPSGRFAVNRMNQPVLEVLPHCLRQPK